MVKFEDVKDMSTEEYFNNNQFSIDVFNKKYRIGDETYVKALKRVCDYIASAESTEELRTYWSEKWFDEIFNDWWHPAGSIMQGANSGKKISSGNCTTISLGVNDNENEWDNLESIFKNTAYTVAKTAAYRQGLGLDFSRIRPAKMSVLNSSKESQGAIHWMKFIDSIGNFIGQLGRQPAILCSLNVNHPDVIEFIKVKSDYTKIQNANISVQITNDFMEAVKNDSVWEMSFEIPEVNVGDKVYIDEHSIDKDCVKDENGKYYKLATKKREYEKFVNTIPARELLELLAKNMRDNAEPGIQFIDMAKHWSNSDYVYDENAEYDSRIISTNAPFIGSTIVNTKEYGQKTIKELYDIGSASLYVCNGVTPDGSMVTTVKSSFKKYDNQEVWNVSLENGKVFSCNGEHKWKIGSSMVETKNLSIGDKLTLVSITENYPEPEYIKISSVEKTENFEDMYCAVVPEYHEFLVDDGYITSNCSEQYLSRESLCILSSLNCGKFSKDNYEKELENIAPSVNRFLDNVNEMEVRDNTYATPHQKLAIEMLRRTGAGLTNISGWLFKHNLEYGSKEGNEVLEKFNERYNYYLYKSSIELGEEKGNFGLFNEEKYTQSPFIKHMMTKGLKFKTMRNVTCSSIAPTGCVEENTRILTDKGLIKIKDLIPENKYPLEKQFNHDVPDIIVTNENVNSKVTAFYNNGVVEGYSITLEDGRVINASESHRVRILKDGNYEWEYVSNIKENDIIIVSNNSDIDVSEYVKLDTTLMSEHFANSKVTLPDVLDESLAEFLGLFTGDGSIKFRSENGKGDAIRFPIFGGDPDLVDWVINFVKEKFGLNAKVTKCKRSNMYEIYIHSKNLCDFIINNGFAKKNTISKNVFTKEHIYHIPEHIFRSPKSVIRAYIRGLFEADGSICNTLVSFATKHYHIATEVQELLTHVGIQSIVQTTKRKKDCGSYSKNDIHRLSVRYKNSFLKYAKEIRFLSSRKNNRLDDRLNMTAIKIDYESIYLLVSTVKKYREMVREKFGNKHKLYARLSTKINNKKQQQNGITFLNRDILKEIYDIFGEDLPFDFNKYSTLKVSSVNKQMMNTFDLEVSDDTHTYVTSNGAINHNTLSLMFRDFVMSYGVEPAFGIYFWKRTRISGKYEYYFCVPNVVREYFKESGYEIPMDSDTIKDTWDGSIGREIAKFIDDNKNTLGIKFKGSVDIKVQDKLDLMARLMKDVDSSISVTYNLPENSTWKDTYDLILGAYEKGVKSIAAFPDKKMYGIVSFIPFKDLAVKLMKENVAIYDGNLSEDEQKELGIMKSNSQATSSNAPKRNKTLDHDVYVVTSKGKKYVVSVGKQNGKLYEVFGGKIPDSLQFKFTHKNGKMTKISQGHYTLEIGDDIVINDFGEIFTAEEQMLFRMISTSLRHGIPIKYVVQQMSKAVDDMTSLSSVVGRVLKKYIVDGETANGMTCPSCGSKELIYGDGCVSCSCGWSRCN